MSTAEKMEDQAVTVDEALAMLISAYDCEVKQHNQLIDSLDSQESENTFLKMQLSNIKDSNSRFIEENEQLTKAFKKIEDEAKGFDKKAKLVTENANKHMQLLAQKDRELVQALMKIDDLQAQIKLWKQIASTPKKVREKIKGLQENVSKQQGVVTQHKLTKRDLDRKIHELTKANVALSRQLDEVDYTKVYSKNGDNVAIFPVLAETAIGQGNEKQVPLLYLDDNGVGALYMLNEDDEASRAKTPKTGIKPKKETLDVMSTLLRKFKRNGNVVHADDVRMLETSE